MNLYVNKIDNFQGTILRNIKKNEKFSGHPKNRP